MLLICLSGHNMPEPPQQENCSASCSVPLHGASYVVSHPKLECRNPLDIERRLLVGRQPACSANTAHSTFTREWPGLLGIGSLVRGLAHAPKAM